MLPRRTELRIDPQATARLVDGARSRGVTVNTLLQMAWALVVSRLTDRDDVVFGVTVSGRPAELAGVETMIGLFINTVPLRVRLDGAVASVSNAVPCSVTPRCCASTATSDTRSCGRWAVSAKCSTLCWFTRISR